MGRYLLTLMIVLCVVMYVYVSIYNYYTFKACFYERYSKFTFNTVLSCESALIVVGELLDICPA